MGENAPEEDESIEVVRVRLAQVAGMIASGEIQDCKSIASLIVGDGEGVGEGGTFNLG